MTIPPDLKDRVAALERLAPVVPPVFHHLFALLPPPGAEFPTRQRVSFLKALSATADMIYGPAPMKIQVEPAQE